MNKYRLNLGTYAAKVLLCIGLAGASVTMHAAEGDTFTYEGIIYTITSETPPEISITGYDRSYALQTVDIPPAVNGYNVMTVGASAFYEIRPMTARSAR